MKKILLTIALLVLTAHALTAQKITFMPQWTPQSQFSGYYLALEKGFYRDEGLDVTIKHLSQNSTESLLSKLLQGEAQMVGQQLMQGIIARADGNPILNVMQLTQVSGLWCVSHKPLSKLEDLSNLTIGKWRSGYSEICELIQFYYNIPINWVSYTNGISYFIFNAVDAMLCYSYSEYIALTLSIGEIPDENVLKFSDFGFDCPEDGLYVTEEYYNAHKEEVEKFVKASKKGWDYARKHPAEASEIGLRYAQDAHIRTNSALQDRMVAEHLKLQVNPATGRADYAPVNKATFTKIVDALYNTGFITYKIKYEDLIR